MEKMSIADPEGKEVGYLDYSVELDLDLGDTNDFEFAIKLASWNRGGLNYGYHIFIPDTEICAVPAEDFSESEEYNSDNRIQYVARDYRRGINHLICAGTGEGTDRTILHLYVQSDGSIGSTKYYAGLDERTALYSYTSQSDVEELRKDGIKRLQELMDYKQFDMTVDDVDISIGDTVSGRDYTTGILVRKPVVQKILKIEKGKMNVEYKLKGGDN